MAGGPYRSTDPRAALDALPRVPDQRYGIRARLAHLADLPDWAATAGAIPGTSPMVPSRLAEIVDAAVRHPDETHAALVRRHFGDTTPGASMKRFLDACDVVVREREAALAERAARSAEAEAAAATTEATDADDAAGRE